MNAGRPLSRIIGNRGAWDSPARATYDAMARGHNPYEDGYASGRIAKDLAIA